MDVTVDSSRRGRASACAEIVRFRSPLALAREIVRLRADLVRLKGELETAQESRDRWFKIARETSSWRERDLADAVAQGAREERERCIEAVLECGDGSCCAQKHVAAIKALAPGGKAQTAEGGPK